MNKEKNIWFSSDFHLAHAVILTFEDSRPWTNIDKMDIAIIDNCNKVIQPDDDFYFLGDFCFNDKKCEWYLSSIPGNKFFIKGNHDHRKARNLFAKYGTFLGDMWNGVLAEQEFTLCHYAMRTWYHAGKGAMHLYGHSHGNLKEDQYARSMDIGIMNNDWYPFNLKQIITHLSKKEFKPVDHHGRHNRD